MAHGGSRTKGASSNIVNDKTKGKNTKNKVLKELFSTAIYLLIVLGVTWLLVKFVGQRTVVDGSSMNPTLIHNDSLWVDKISYRFSNPKRFDIVVFPYKYEENTYYIKRIIGLPGETVSISDGYIYINGNKLDENYGLEVIDDRHYGRAELPVTLGDNEYFVMGDNRNNSIDSRFEAVGNVQKKDFIGKAVFRLFPFNKIGPLRK